MLARQVYGTNFICTVIYEEEALESREEKRFHLLALQLIQWPGGGVGREREMFASLGVWAMNWQTGQNSKPPPW